MAMSDAKRAAKYRWAHRMERAMGKVTELIAAMPQKYKDNRSSSPVETEWLLWECLADLLKTDIEFVKEGEQEYVRFKIPNFGLNFGLYGKEQTKAIIDYEEYVDAKRHAQKERASPVQVKSSRNAFCVNQLGAKLANLRWGWVGMEEELDGNPGKLYLFAWEHNKGVDGEGTVRLFHEKVSVDPNGRKRPGHRDALEKIGRAQRDELTPYVVWQKAQDPSETPKKIEFINGSFVSRVDLYVDGEGYWTGRLCEDVPIEETEE